MSDAQTMQTAANASHTPQKPLIAVSMGDAAGVGPELCLRLLTQPPENATPIVIGSYELLTRVARATGISLNVPRLLAAPDQPCAGPAVLDCPGHLDAAAVVPAQNQALCGAASAHYIELAVQGALVGKFAAIVTAPISKKALSLAGIDFPGHTEMLAHLTKTNSFAMLFYSPQMCCAFVTCHQSLMSVGATLSVERIVDVATLAWNNLAPLQNQPLPLAILGLNPHASEEGLFGHEEEQIIIPAIQALRARGILAEGPFPADTAFTPAARTRFSCHICMYHDQGGIPFKMLAFDTGVNVTMGLPIIRTSPDHGTAFDIAWKGKVQPESFLSAFDLATRLALKK